MSESQSGWPHVAISMTGNLPVEVNQYKQFIRGKEIDEEQSAWYDTKKPSADWAGLYGIIGVLRPTDGAERGDKVAA
jgi:hypothetical protein